MADVDDMAGLERRARNGEAWAFGQIVRHHEHALRGLVYSVVRNKEQTDDVLQAAFEKAFRRIKTFQGDAPMKSWLQSICYRAALDHLRYEGRRRHLDLGAVIELSSGDDVAGRVETLDHFDAVMASLDPETRALLLLTAGHGHTLADAAQIAGLPVGTVASRLSRARRLLRLEAP